MMEWLKTSIPGIILLGAVGSLLAVGLLKVTYMVIEKIIRPATNTLAGRLFVIVRTPHYVIEHIRSTSTDIRELIVTCTILIIGFVLAVIGVLVSMMIATSGVIVTEIIPGSKFGAFSIFWGSFCGFLIGLGMKKILDWTFEIYNIYMGKAETDAKIKAIKEFEVRETS